MLCRKDFYDYLVNKLTKTTKDNVTIAVNKDNPSIIFINTTNPKCNYEVNFESMYLNYVNYSKENSKDDLFYADKIIDMFFTTVLYENKAELTLDYEKSCNKIYPYLRSNEILDNIKNSLIHETITKEILMTYVIDYENKMRYVTKDDLKTWNKSPEDIKKISMKNFVRDKDASLTKMDLPFGESCFTFDVGDNYDATRILLQGRINQLKSSIDGKLTVTMPNRDYVFLFGNKMPLHVRMGLLTLANDLYHRDNYGISPYMYDYENGSFSKSVI